MANGSSDNQQQQPLTGDQTVALLRYMNPNISQSVLDQAQKDPGGFGTRILGGASYGGYTTGGSGGVQGVVGAQPVAPLVGLLQAFQPPPPQQQQQQPTQSLSASIPQQQVQAYTPATNPLVATPPPNAPTTQTVTPYATAAMPQTVQVANPQVTPANPTGSMYNLPQSFQPPQQQQYRRGGLVKGYQGGGQVQVPQVQMPYSNPLYSISDLGAAALGSIFGTAYGTPVYNQMPNQGQMSIGGVYGTGGGQPGQGGQGGQGAQPAYTLGVPAATQQGGVWAPEGGVFTQMPGVFGPGGGPNAPMGGNVAYQQTGNPVYSQAYPGATNAQWNQVGQAAGLSQRDINEFQAQGLSPAQVAARFNVAAPAQSGPSTPGQYPLMATPWATGTGWGQPAMAGTPTATGTPTRAATPFATAPMPGQALPPAAPGLPGIMPQGQPGIARPTAFGGAYTGYTAGVPGVQPAQPAPYTGTVHNDPFMSHAVSTLLGLPSNPWHAPDGSPRGGGAAQAVSAGGGAGDVAQAASMALATAPKGPVKMQAGGYVRGYQQGGTVDNQEPSEVRRGTLTVPQSGGGQASQPQGQSSQSAQSAQATVNNVGNSMASFYGGQPPGAAASAAPAAPGIGTLAGEQAYVTGEPVSGIPGGGGLTQQQGNALAGGIGAIGGAFQQALQKTAQTPWRWQPAGAWANPQNVPKESEPQFRQEQVPQEQRGRMPYGMPYGYGMTPPY